MHSMHKVKRCKPEKVYSKFVVLGAFLTEFFTFGFIRSFGVIGESLHDLYPSLTPEDASWIPGTLNALTLMTSPLSGYINKRYGYRPVVCFGGILAASGLIISSFTVSAYFLIFSCSIIVGCGFSMAILGCISYVGEYFEADKNRSVAVAVSMSGASIGAMAMPQIIEAIVYEFSFRGAFLFLGGVYLHLTVSGMLFRPFSSEGYLYSDDEGPCRITAEEEDRQPVMTTNPRTRRVPLCLEWTWKKIARIMSLRYLGRLPFLLATLSVILVANIQPHFLFYVIDHAEDLGIESAKSVNLLTCIGIGDLLGHAAVGLLVLACDHFPRSILYASSIALAGLSIFLFAIARSYALLVLFSVTFGIGSGACQCVIPIFLGDIYGAEAVANTYGLLFFFQGAVNFVVPVVAESLRQSTGSTVAIFYYMTAAALCATLLAIGLALMLRKRSKTTAMSTS